MKSRENRKRRLKRNDKFLRRVMAKRLLPIICKSEAKNKDYYEIQWGRFRVKQRRDGRRSLDRQRSTCLLVPNTRYRELLKGIAEQMKGKSFTIEIGDGQQVEMVGTGADVLFQRKS